MDLKCFECVVHEYSMGQVAADVRGEPPLTPEAAAEKANAAVTMLDGTAACAPHAVRVPIHHRRPLR